MKPLLFKTISDHFILCVLLCLLWCVTDSKSTTTATGTSATQANTTTTQLTTPSTTLLTTKQPPPNAEEFKSVNQNETSITLRWKTVTGILNYILKFNGTENDVPASGPLGNYPLSGLTSMTEYNFTLFTVFKDIRSSGVIITAFTAPPNADEFKSVDRNETSITLQWKTVTGILNYILKFNGTENDVPASGPLGNYMLSGLTSMTEYNFTLFTVFKDIRSSGVIITAFTAPRNAEEFKSVDQTETSITLQWQSVNDILNYILKFNGTENDVPASPVYVQKKTDLLSSGTKYNFTLFTVFKTVRSSGVTHSAATVPSMVALVNVTERSVNSITLMWTKEKKDWAYFVQINEENSKLLPNTAMNDVFYPITSLKPGTEYTYSVITTFYDLNSTAYKGFTVTAINCTNVAWRVTNSSIQGLIKGLFSNATATNQSQTHVSLGGENVSFSGLYPGATYEVSLAYERDSTFFLQCSHNLTIYPPYVRGHCEYWAAGYSVSVVWNEPEGVWTSVEVSVSGETHTVNRNVERQLIISGFLPARTYEVSLASLSGTVRSLDPFVFLCLTDPRGVIAGSVFAVLLFGVLVCLVVFIFWKRPDIISRKKAFIGGSRESNKKFKAISVAKFPDHFYQLSMDENRGFSQEYESLVPVGTEQTRKVAILPENKPKNRFNNVQPYDWCRVKLTTSNPNNTSDYINASYMPGYNSKIEYIASQGPLPSTVNDFWRMIWEQKVKGIVMVTNCTEGGRTKCERYWPADRNPCPYGELTVTIRSEQQKPDWTLREFRVKHINHLEERTVKHFHFTAWPDHGVPQGTDVLIQFRGLVRQHIEREGDGAPTVVHCSAGVGRTGTIIALDVLLQQLEKERAVGIHGFVHKMRLSRPYMVQTESQYVFLHQCIMDCLPNEKTEEHIYENADMIYANADMIYANATALRELRTTYA
ncbi:receptor-type tyrosine-protein phosphatase H-like isoform X2 [Etheostoma cragini]|uniref:receptor-type tyrosine-protein phosphatase H-like isoform X2 n=1 Tax=Etheostoma cragini TaxID=417921 RepID=UPI00155E68E2|nr:receptor-type tyrosine-protein phosphatase H-like isoform X2 [Etheostoma cragini]